MGKSVQIICHFYYENLIVDLHTQLYAALNVSIALVEVITWTKGDIFVPVAASLTMINSVEEYGLTISTPRDSLILLT